MAPAERLHRQVIILPLEVNITVQGFEVEDWIQGLEAEDLREVAGRNPEREVNTETQKSESPCDSISRLSNSEVKQLIDGGLTLVNQFQPFVANGDHTIKHG